MVLKYIIIKNSGAILFPEIISHSQVGNLFNQEPMIPESAGFAVMEDGKCVGVYGNAVSMKGLPSLPGDEHVINDFLSPASLIKYYHASTQSVREEGLEKADKNRPGMLIVKVPDNWTEQNVRQFRETWQRLIESPGNAVKITLVDVFDNTNQVVK